MRSLLLPAAVVAAVAIFTPADSAHAYADRRTYKFGEPNRVIFRYEVDRAAVLEGATASYHCVYFARDGRCQAVAKEYNNVRSPKVVDRNYYLDVTPSTVSPRAMKRPTLYVRPQSYYYGEYVPTYQEHYRRVHSVDDGMQYGW